LLLTSGKGGLGEVAEQVGGGAIVPPKLPSGGAGS